MDADGNKLIQKMKLGETQKVKIKLRFPFVIFFSRQGLAKASTVSLLGV